MKTDLAAEDVDPAELDAMVLPGGLPGTHNLEASPAVQHCIESCVKEGKLVAAICAAPPSWPTRACWPGKTPPPSPASKRT